jgi:predicted phage terminase large subunit-like protein
MSIKTEVQVKIEEGRQRCKTDKQYLSEVLGYDFVPAVHAELWKQFFQYDDTKPFAKQSDIAKVLILWPRGHYKTTAVVVDIIQLILNFPDIRILIMRGGIAITKAWLNEIRAHFTGRNPNSNLAKFFPEFCTDGDLGNSMSFTVPARQNMGLAQATVTVASPNSIKTGTHYDIGFFDDLVNDQNYRSATKLGRVQQDFMMCLPLIDPPFYAVMTGTRYAFGDVYENIMRNNLKGEWRISFRICWVDEKHTFPLFPQQESRDKKKLIGFTREQLNFMQASDPEMFASQYLNQPIQKGGQRFTKELLTSCVVKWFDPSGQSKSRPRGIPETVVGNLSPAIMFVDLASTDSEESDDSCIVVGKHDLKMTQYVVDVRGGKWLPPMFAEQIILAAIEYRPRAIYLEKSSSCIYFMDYLRLVARDKKVFLPLDFLKIDQKKDAKYTRIASLQGLMQYKRLQFFEGIEQWGKVVQQFEMFPGGKHKHDDYADTIALFATHMVGQMSQEPVRPKINPIMEMVRQQEQVTLADQILERQNIPVDPSDGFDAFNSGWSAAQGPISIIPD